MMPKEAEYFLPLLQAGVLLARFALQATCSFLCLLAGCDMFALPPAWFKLTTLHLSVGKLCLGWIPFCHPGHLHLNMFLPNVKIGWCTRRASLLSEHMWAERMWSALFGTTFIHSGSSNLWTSRLLAT